MDDFRIRVRRGGRAALSIGVSTLVGFPVACASKKSAPGSDTSPTVSSAAGTSGAAGLAGALGNSMAGNAACSTPAACGVGGAPNVVIALPSGGKPSVMMAVSGAAGTGTMGGGAACVAPALVAPGCLVPLEDESGPGLCNQLDDDCDGIVDEGCACSPGAVQPCFLGPPGRRGVGACADGAQICETTGELSTRWGPCTGGIRPGPEVCDGIDNDCNGCSDDVAGCKPQGMCPGPGDPRTPSGSPFTPYVLRGREFFDVPGATWSWTVQGGPCDALTPESPSFTLTGANTETATFTPKLSGDYTVTLTVLPESGPPFTCTWIVHVHGPGLRIEMCYPESSTRDLDLYVKQPGRTTPWFTGQAQFSAALDQCCWANCEANLRGGSVMPPQTVVRADWGYPTSPLSLCEGGPQGLTWQTLGYCSSPRLDIDNNLSEATGVPENVNIDAPRDGETFRIMVANFTGTLAHPLVNVYCDGHRAATIGAPPDQVPNFTGPRGSFSVGALWRVADVTTHVTSDGTTCTVDVLHPPGSSAGFDVTVDDPRY